MEPVISSSHVVNKYRQSRSSSRKVGDDVCRRITNLLPTSANAVKLRGKYIARGGPTEVSRQSESFLSTPIAFPASNRIISLWFTAFPSSLFLLLLLLLFLLRSISFLQRGPIVRAIFTLQRRRIPLVTTVRQVRQQTSAASA